MRPLAVLRPEPGNAATAQAIEARGRRAIRLPLFTVRPVAWDVPDPARFDALVVTSANAFRHGGAGLDALRRLPVHAVGAATAAAARVAGFVVVQVGSSDAAALLGELAGKAVLHLAGREHRSLAGVRTAIVYASEEAAPDLSPLHGAVALVHSPRAAALLTARITERDAIALAAISAAARVAAGEGWAAAAVADVPTDAALIDAAIGLSD